MLDIVQIAVMSDNYIYLLHDHATGLTAVVDPAVEAPVVDELMSRGWQLDFILNTHHHGDHVGANMALKAKYGCTIVGPKADERRIPGIDIALSDGETFTFGDHIADVYDVPGHTLGHCAYHFKTASALFCGDALFALGCGRMFEGNPAQMLNSLDKMAALPADTRIYCAHEYTLSNGKFALSIDPDNQALIKRMETITALRNAGTATVPSLMGDELATNPFLRTNDPILAANIGLNGADRVVIFAKTRSLKDTFRG